jgi:CBS domain-containing protein
MDIRDVMTPDPIVCPPGTDVQAVAQIMRDRQIGDVLVGDGSGPIGIVTDRDLVVRCLAEQTDLAETTVGQVCTTDVRSIDVDASIEELIDLMERNSLRRVPVLADGAPGGIVSLGDLATHLDPSSLLGEISSAPPDRA